MPQPDPFIFYVLLVALSAVVALSFILMVTQHHKRQAESRMLRQQMDFDFHTTLLKARIEVHEQSMALVSDELHDNLAQMMAVAKRYIDLGLPKLPEGEGKKLMTMARDMQTAVGAKIRNISHSLSNDLLKELGLTRSAARMIESMERIGIATSFDVTGTPVKLPQEQDLLVFRIIQELIQNVIKHAAATLFTVEFNYGPEMLVVRLQDDGKGFDPSMLDSSEHLGLISIRSRVTLLGARLKLTTGSGKGAIYELSIPIQTHSQTTIL